jgi:hypothetical protein
MPVYTITGLFPEGRGQHLNKLTIASKLSYIRAKQFMDYFLIAFQANIDGTEIETGLLGATPYYDPNTFKNKATRRGRLKHPNARQVAIVAMDVKPVTSEEYYEGLKQAYSRAFT